MIAMGGSAEPRKACSRSLGPGMRKGQHRRSAAVASGAGMGWCILGAQETESLNLRPKPELYQPT